MSRRRFIKRTGGASVATLAAWNLASESIQAQGTPPSGSYDINSATAHVGINTPSFDSSGYGQAPSTTQGGYTFAELGKPSPLPSAAAIFYKVKFWRDSHTPSHPVDGHLNEHTWEIAPEIFGEISGTPVMVTAEPTTFKVAVGATYGNFVILATPSDTTANYGPFVIGADTYEVQVKLKNFLISGITLSKTASFDVEVSYKKNGTTEVLRNWISKVIVSAHNH